jgi:hypothetical protein
LLIIFKILNNNVLSVVKDDEKDHLGDASGVTKACSGSRGDTVADKSGCAGCATGAPAWVRPTAIRGGRSHHHPAAAGCERGFVGRL